MLKLATSDGVAVDREQKRRRFVWRHKRRSLWLPLGLLATLFLIVFAIASVLEG